MTAMLPAHLTESLNNLGDAAKVLADEVREDRAQRAIEAGRAADRQRRQNRTMVTLLAIIGVLVVALVTITVQNRLRSNQNSEILRQTARTSAQIADCTTVGGKCYEQGAARTSDVLRMIIRSQIYFASCSKLYSSDPAIEQCVMRKLAASSATTAPTPAPSAQPSVPAPSGSPG